MCIYHGSETQWVPISQIKVLNAYIIQNSKAIYSLDWKWEETDQDTQIQKNELSKYIVYINVYSEDKG